MSALGSTGQHSPCRIPRFRTIDKTPAFTGSTGPEDDNWVLRVARPEAPIAGHGARGIGEPPVASGCSAVLNAIAAAVGDEIFRRAPVNADGILASLEAGKPMMQPLTANV